MRHGRSAGRIKAVDLWGSDGARTGAPLDLLLLTNPGSGVITPLVTGEKPYAIADFEPIVSICGAPLVIVANPSFPPKNTLHGSGEEPNFPSTPHLQVRSIGQVTDTPRR